MKVNVLVFPAGEVNSIELHDALSTCVNVNVFGASSIDRHGGYVFENYTGDLPLISDLHFFDTFNAYLEQHKIDFIFPTHDTIALFLRENETKINAKILVADLFTCQLCRNKQKTYDFFKDYDFIPKTYKEITTFPVFLKPKEGQGAVGTYLIKAIADIPANLHWEDYLICEYLPGEECTVDCLTNKDGELQVVSPRVRSRLMAGISAAGTLIPLTKKIKIIAQTINDKLGFLGLWWFQLKKDATGKWKLLEISTRCAGSMALTRVSGLNLPLLTVYVALGYDIKTLQNRGNVQMDSTLIRRYKYDYNYQKVYIDFDDTIIVRGRVNLKMIWFIYQCKNKGIKLYLLTKHADTICETLKKYALSEALFDEIIHIQPNERKSHYIKECDDVIFIDNMHAERLDVYQNNGIPCFDVDAVDVLMDWRI